MHVWVNRQLDLILETSYEKNQEQARSNWSAEKYADWRASEQLPAFREAQAINAAEHGNIEPLRELYPKLVRFLFRPKRPNKSPFPKNRPLVFADRVSNAADDVRRIRAIWKLHYGKKNQPGLAEEIAAERWTDKDKKGKMAVERVSEDDVAERLRHMKK